MLQNPILKASILIRPFAVKVTTIMLPFPHSNGSQAFRSTIRRT